MTYIITFDYLEGDVIDFSWGKFELLHIEALKKQIDARDFIDALWKTMLFLSQSATHIMTGDWKSILTFTDSVAEFESEYFYHCSQYSIVIAGNNHLLHDSSVHSWEKRFLDALELGHKVKKNCKGPELARITNQVK